MKQDRIRLNVTMPDGKTVTRSTKMHHTHAVVMWSHGPAGWEWSVLSWHPSERSAEKSAAPLLEWIAVSGEGRVVKILPTSV
jgi:hypothetical protein